jgi:hypothetical protein
MALEADGDKAADEFMKRLKDGYYDVSRSQNSEDDYTENKQERDTQAVKEFFGTDLSKYIQNLK